MLRPNLDLQTTALTYYLTCHVKTLTETPSLTNSLSECVAAWHVSGRISPMVDLAISTMALAVFGKTHKYIPAATEATSRYDRLLRTARKRISDVAKPTMDAQEIDACLTAIFLMGRYEAVRYRRGDHDQTGSSKSLQCWAHHDGAMAILKAWNDNIDAPATIVMKHTRRGLIKSSLLRNLSLPDWILNGERFGEHDLELEYDRIAVRIVNLHHGCVSVQRNNGLHIAKVEELKEEALELDKALQDWTNLFPSTWSFQSYLPKEPGVRTRVRCYPSTVYNDSRYGYGVLWCEYFAARLVVNHTILSLLRLSHSGSTVDVEYDLQSLNCAVRLRDMANGLSSSIPFCLERFKVTNGPDPGVGLTSSTPSTNEEIKPYLVNLVIWPLAVATSVDGLDVRQRLWFKTELARLGEIIGHNTLGAVEATGWAAN